MGIILMFWLYFGVMAILIGGQINMYMERTDLLRTIYKNDGTQPLLLPVQDNAKKKRRNKNDKEDSEPTDKNVENDSDNESVNETSEFEKNNESV